MSKQPLQESETVELKKSLVELMQGLVSMAAILNKHQAGPLTIDDLRKGNISQRRNPLIADLFRRIEMVEAWGRGMPLILKYAPDVVFREIGNLFIVGFNRPSFLEQKDEGEAATQETTQENSKVPKETPEKPQRSPKEVILAALKKQPTISHQGTICSVRHECPQRTTPH